MPRDIIIATGTRADWGLLHPLAIELQSRGTKLTIAATNTHLGSAHTVDEIIADGFDPVRIPAEGTPSEITAHALMGFSAYFETRIHDHNRPDAIVILGDRFEMLGVASASLLHGIPVIHIAGGTISEGAFDDSIRHAISKMAWIHFPETDRCRERLISMGEDPEMVTTAGALGVYNVTHARLMDKQQLEHSLGWQIPPTTILATLHAATLDCGSPSEQMRQFIDALEILIKEYDTRGEEIGVIFTYPNNDTDPGPQISQIEAFATRHPHKVLAIPSLGRIRYLSALQYVCAVAGNSSSGLVEVPSAGIPTLDVGIRQSGRECGDSVTHCGADTDSVAEGLRKVLSPEMRALALHAENPYYRCDTPALMADRILSAPLPAYPKKTFHDQQR